MEVVLGMAGAQGAPADLLAVGVFAGLEPAPGADEAIAGLGTPVQPLLETRGFTGKAGESFALPTLGRLPAATLLLVGLGERDSLDAEALRRAGGTVARESRGAGLSDLLVDQVTIENPRRLMAVE